MNDYSAKMNDYSAKMNDYSIEYDEYGEEYVQSTETEFIINTPELADWAIEKIKEEESAAEQFAEVCNKKAANLKEMANIRMTNAAKNTAFLRSALREYMRTAATKKTKTGETLELPSGKARLIYSAPKLEPDKTMLAKVLSGTDYVENVPTVKWGEYKKLLKIVNGQAVRSDTGEIAEGVNVTESEERIEIK